MFAFDSDLNHLVLLHRKNTLLGYGQFGEVYKGIWETPWDGPQEVAIKMLKEASSDIERVKFLQEAAIMAQFRHPHIVRLLGSVTVDEPVSVYLHEMCVSNITMYSAVTSIANVVSALLLVSAYVVNATSRILTWRGSQRSLTGLHSIQVRKLAAFRGCFAPTKLVFP